MERKFKFSVGEYYHLYNRGNDKKKIFLSEHDTERFMRLLFLCNSQERVLQQNIPNGKTFETSIDTPLVAIGVYCLMPNHFHILLKEIKEDGISLFMQKLATGYSMYFNKKYERTGTLFEGRFKATHVDNDMYLKYLFAYIHLNPIKLIDANWKENGLKDRERVQEHLNNYASSSYFDYIGKDRGENKILNTKVFPEYFETTNQFDHFINDWLSSRSDLDIKHAA